MSSTSYLPQAHLAGSRFLQSWVEIRDWLLPLATWPLAPTHQHKAVVDQPEAEQTQAQARYEEEGLFSTCMVSSQNHTHPYGLRLRNTSIPLLGRNGYCTALHPPTPAPHTHTPPRPRRNHQLVSLFSF